MVVLPAMRAFSRPLRTWARMILAGPGKGLGLRHAQQGAVGDGDA